MNELIIKIYENPYSWIITMVLIYFIIWKPLYYYIFLPIRSMKFFNFFVTFAFYTDREAIFNFEESDYGPTTIYSSWNVNIRTMTTQIDAMEKALGGVPDHANLTGLLFRRLLDNTKIPYYEYWRLDIIFRQNIDDYSIKKKKKKKIKKNKKHKIDKGIEKIKTIKQCGLYKDELIFEKELIKKFYIFSPNEIEINNFLKYLKRELLITENEKLWFTGRGLATANDPIRNSDSEFDKLVQLLTIIKP